MSLQVPGLAAEITTFVHGEQDRFVSKRLREAGIWEPYESALLLRMLGPGQVFVDVGANIGYFSLLAAHCVGSAGAVYAFEPDPANHELLVRSVGVNDYAHIVHAEQAGLSEQTGAASLYLSEDNLGDHQIFATHQEREAVPIRLLNGSRFLGPRIQRLDVVKIDTQGSEYGVVKGLMPLFTRLPQPPRVIIELTPLSLRQCGSSGRALIELLSELEQDMWIIDHVEHRLVSSTAAELAQWCDDVDAVPGDAGFMNILIGPAPR
ncbi:FkbM family methyltransferase [Pseudohalioglobus lutimaris]|uniref:FkbM family methyltransferase n=1 Tax=Pseudohalioglobus lutimaris TaxID=1737061 RepID=A0A2N5WYI9_9GAMM|nr:FkbM family methyltransferase [Pseudohalioglobus lutimaris]PLW67303.1 FkbM family methyltransferase [Pseudohalioglobus lutimaris]